MRRAVTFTLALLTLGLAGLTFSPDSRAQEKKKAKAPNPVLAPVKDDPALPRVLVIGDSISMGYTLPVRKRLEGKANVHRIAENGGPTSNGVAKIDKWLGNGKWDVITFNWGLHDLRRDADDKVQVPLEQYEKNLRELVRKMKATGAKLIWVSTTPVPEGKLTPPRKNSDVLAYNAAARKVMDENGVTVLDLYGFAAAKLDKIQRPANVHFTDEGSEALAGPVAAGIAAALGAKK